VNGELWMRVLIS